jgi:NADH:ubiquinone oxidoreductase subunit 2 (subunit N)
MRGLLAEDRGNVPHLDYHALLPELILGATVLVVLGVDLVVPPARRYLAGVAGLVGLLAAFLPLVTLANCEALFSCTAGNRTMFGGSYVVDGFALVVKGSSWWPGPSCSCSRSATCRTATTREYYFLVLVSVLGR